LNLLEKYQAAGPLACEDAPPVRGSTDEIMAAYAADLERRARFLDVIAKKFEAHEEITEDDIPF
jgi:hypothetical protein